MRAETYSFAGDICNGGQITLKWIISESVTEMWIGRNCFRVEQSAGLHYHIIRQLDPVLKDHIGLLQSVCLGNLSNTLHKAVTAQFEGARCVSFRFVTLRCVTLRYVTLRYAFRSAAIKLIRKGQTRGIQRRYARRH